MIWDYDFSDKWILYQFPFVQINMNELEERGNYEVMLINKSDMQQRKGQASGSDIAVIQYAIKILQIIASQQQTLPAIAKAACCRATLTQDRFETLVGT